MAILFYGKICNERKEVNQQGSNKDHTRCPHQT